MAQIPEVGYATAEDGTSIAYQTVGDGPVDLVLELENWGNVEITWELAPLADLFERLGRFLAGRLAGNLDRPVVAMRDLDLPRRGRWWWCSSGAEGV